MQKNHEVATKNLVKNRVFLFFRWSPSVPEHPYALSPSIFLNGRPLWGKGTGRNDPLLPPPPASVTGMFQFGASLTNRIAAEPRPPDPPKSLQIFLASQSCKILCARPSAARPKYIYFYTSVQCPCRSGISSGP